MWTGPFTYGYTCGFVSWCNLSVCFIALLTFSPIGHTGCQALEYSGFRRKCPHVRMLCSLINDVAGSVMLCSYHDRHYLISTYRLLKTFSDVFSMPLPVSKSWIRYATFLFCRLVAGLFIYFSFYTFSNPRSYKWFCVVWWIGSNMAQNKAIWLNVSFVFFCFEWIYWHQFDHRLSSFLALWRWLKEPRVACVIKKKVFSLG